MNKIIISGVVIHTTENNRFILSSGGDFFYCYAPNPPRLFDIITIEGQLRSVVRNCGRDRYVTYCIYTE